MVVSGGASVDNFHRMFGSLRLRYFGPRPLVADNSVRSKATTLLNLRRGTDQKNLRVNLLVFNLANSTVSDIDYYFASRLPGDPAGRGRRPSHASIAAAHGESQPGRGLLIHAA